MKLLGHKVKDLQTGSEGIAISYIENLSGTTQYGIQPQVKAGDTTVPNANGFDIDTIVDKGKGISDKVKKPNARKFNFGDEVKDTATGFKGRVTAFTTFINGCVHCLIECLDKDGKPLYDSFSVARLEYVNPPAVKVKATKTGGPITRAIRTGHM
jgi:hypothetical protein